MVWRYEGLGKSPQHGEHVFSLTSKSNLKDSTFILQLCDVGNTEIKEEIEEQELPDCKKCRGDKWISTRRKTPSGQGRYMEKCPRCAGTGKEPQKK